MRKDEYESIMSYKEMKGVMEEIGNYTIQNLGKPTIISRDWHKKFLRKTGAWIEWKLFWKDKFPTIDFLVMVGELENGYITIDLYSKMDKKIGYTYPILNKFDLDKIIEFVKKGI